jgi:hypothetical protein
MHIHEICACLNVVRNILNMFEHERSCSKLVATQTCKSDWNCSTSLGKCWGGFYRCQKCAIWIGLMLYAEDQRCVYMSRAPRSPSSPWSRPTLGMPTPWATSPSPTSDRSLLQPFADNILRSIAFQLQKVPWRNVLWRNVLVTWRPSGNVHPIFRPQKLLSL